MTTKILTLTTRTQNHISKIRNQHLAEFDALTAKLVEFYKDLLQAHRELMNVWYTLRPRIAESPIPMFPGSYNSKFPQKAVESIIASKIEELLPNLQKIAWKFAFHGLEPDDTLQDMCLNLLEKAAIHPEFVEQQDAFILKFAKWSAWHLISGNNTYNDYVDSEDWTLDEQNEEVSSFEYIPCDDPTPEQKSDQYESARLLSEVVSKLAPENRAVVKMLYVGYSRSEIASKLNISRPAVTQRINTIKKALRPVCK